MEAECAEPQALKPSVRLLSWQEVLLRLEQWCKAWHAGTKVYGVPTGGMILAGHVGKFGLWNTCNLKEADVILDDVIDSGRTKRAFHERCPDKAFGALYDKRLGAPDEGQWLHFPWEGQGIPEDAAIRIIEYLGEDPNREGLKDTPKRMIAALREMTHGYREDPRAYLDARFDADYDQMVALTGIRFHSVCEHHLLPFAGTADVAYLPKGRVLGISKLARIVRCFAKRLQIQERLTTEIAQCLMTGLEPLGVGVIVRGTHWCMACRGVQARANMVTSAVLGLFREDPAVRDEFLNLCQEGRVW